MADTASSLGDVSLYSEPRIEDYGSLIDLTAAFDVDTLGQLTKGALSLAVVSAAAIPGSGLLPGGASGSTPDSGTLDEVRRGGSTPGSEGVVAGAQGSGGGSGGEKVGEVAGDGGGSGKRLPFSGLNVILTASLGAAVAGAGARARYALRRERD